MHKVELGEQAMLTSGRQTNEARLRIRLKRIEVIQSSVCGQRYLHSWNLDIQNKFDLESYKIVLGLFMRILTILLIGAAGAACYRIVPGWTGTTLVVVIVTVILLVVRLAGR